MLTFFLNWVFPLKVKRFSFFLYFPFLLQNSFQRDNSLRLLIIPSAWSKVTWSLDALLCKAPVIILCFNKAGRQSQSALLLCLTHLFLHFCLNLGTIWDKVKHRCMGKIWPRNFSVPDGQSLMQRTRINHETFTDKLKGFKRINTFFLFCNILINTHTMLHSQNMYCYFDGEVEGQKVFL